MNFYTLFHHMVSTSFAISQVIMNPIETRLFKKQLWATVFFNTFFMLSWIKVIEHFQFEIFNLFNIFDMIQTTSLQTKMIKVIYIKEQYN